MIQISNIKAHGHYVVSIPSYSGSVYAYDTISGEWLYWEEVDHETGVYRSPRSDTNLVPCLHNDCAQLTLDPELVYPHPEQLWAYNPPNCVWIPQME
ncbi:hypothetical protein KIPB_011326 [Kipferlia bialata]|uniref:Uncharacterized protein n=1 Tax=Kipferlia bialata TaxID=797122 RepID=A0A391NQ60_9EUKA|nr:hypothetical protein KIPB_011326 [Kipferlia bialata]|eukprot:g11326.t1